MLMKLSEHFCGEEQVKRKTALSVNHEWVPGNAKQFQTWFQPMSRSYHNCLLELSSVKDDAEMISMKSKF